MRIKRKCLSYSFNLFRQYPNYFIDVLYIFI
nr:MAG TPA: hypothetical protein [Caudoviricetes sp.]DAL04597.1 MAG TPA: hypothetical protein [Caudoviricetes sp.]